MTLDEIADFLGAEFPQVFGAEAIRVEQAEAGRAQLRLSPAETHLRPGAVVSGPTLMMLADAAGYVALLSLGADARMAVTTNLNMSFLRAARLGADIIQSAHVIKPGKRLSVIVSEASDPDGVALAHATMTYAMPARPAARTAS